MTIDILNYLQMIVKNLEEIKSLEKQAQEQDVYIEIYEVSKLQFVAESISETHGLSTVESINELAKNGTFHLYQSDSNDFTIAFI